MKFKEDENHGWLLWSWPPFYWFAGNPQRLECCERSIIL